MKAVIASVAVDAVSTATATAELGHSGTKATVINLHTTAPTSGLTMTMTTQTTRRITAGDRSLTQVISSVVFLLLLLLLLFWQAPLGVCSTRRRHQSSQSGRF